MTTKDKIGRPMVVFIAVSLFFHLIFILSAGRCSIYQPPSYDILIEPTPVVIDLTEIIPLPEEPTPPPVPEAPPIEPEDIEPEPELEPELMPEVLPEPEPDVEPAPAEPPPPTVIPDPEPEPIATTATLDQPVYLRNPPPVYPASARRQGWQGTVLIRVHVDAKGTVTGVTLLQSSGHAVLDASALDTLRRWRFSSARLAGQPIAATVDVPITFTLR